MSKNPEARGSPEGEAAPERTQAAHTSDATIIRRIWVLLVAAVVSLLPFTAFSTFLVPIAEAVDRDSATVGSLRGLGGVAALFTGIAVAPLLARWPRSIAGGAALVLLALAGLLATSATFAALLVFCVLVGVATALLTPVLLSTATQSFSSEADGGRAATLVTAAQTLAAVMAAPVLGVLALVGDWRVPLWATAGLAAALGLLLLLRPLLRQWHSTAAPASASEAAEPPRYWQTFRSLRRRRDLVAAVAVSALRTCAFMGQLSFVAVVYHDRFALGAEAFTLVWTLSGAAFFTGNYLAGRWARAAGSSPRGIAMMLLCGIVGGVLSLPLVTLVPGIVWALAGTALLSLSHAVVAAAITTVIARRGRELTPAAFSLAGAGQSIGVFAGAGLGGLGLGAAGLPGLTVALSLPMLLALILVPALSRPHAVVPSSRRHGPRRSGAATSARSERGR